MNEDRPKVIAHAGVIGSGKGHRSAALVREHGFVQVNFKDALVVMCSDLLGYDVASEYDWFKESIAGARKPANPLAEQNLRAEMRDLLARNPEIVTGRKLLQRLGTDVMRKRDPLYWVDQWRARAVDAILSGLSVTCDDCRFENEFDAVLQDLYPHRAQVIFADYHSDRYDATSDHDSEKMAQALLCLGLKDGDHVTVEHLRSIPIRERR